MEFEEEMVLALETVSSWVGSFMGDLRIQGVVLGFLLSQGATFLRDWFTTRRQAQSVRKMLELEIDHNLEVVICLINRLKRKGKVSSISLDVASLGFHRKAFESQIAFLPTALTEAEISEVYQFYANLSAINVTAELAKEQEGTDSLNLVLKLESIFPDLDSGNPLTRAKGAAKTEKP